MVSMVEDPFVLLVQTISERLEKLGIYVENTAFQGELENLHDIEDGDSITPEIMATAVKSGSGHMTMTAVGRLNELAWRDTTLFPSRALEEDLLASALPTKKEIIAHYMQEQLEAGVPLTEIIIPDDLLK
jgi:hypothetical protein